MDFDVNILISGLGRLMDVPELALNDEDMASVQLDDDVIVDFEYDRDVRFLHVYLPFAKASDFGDVASLRALLRANLDGEACGHGSFGLDEVADDLLVYRGYRSAELDVLDSQQLAEDITALIEAAKAVQWTLDSTRDSTESSPDSHDTFSGSVIAMRG